MEIVCNAGGGSPASNILPHGNSMQLGVTHSGMKALLLRQWGAWCHTSWGIELPTHISRAYLVTYEGLTLVVLL